MFNNLTKKEKEILEYITIASQMHGFPPSLKEIMSHFKLRAISTVHEHIQNLKKKGYIIKEKGVSRNIKIVNQELGDHNFIEVPIIFDLNSNAHLTKIGVLKTIFVHKNNLKGKGKYTAIRVGSTNYTEAGINQNDILIIKEASQLAFNTKAIVSVGEKICIGEIIESKQLPVFKKYEKGSAIVINYEIKGQIIALIRPF